MNEQYIQEQLSLLNLTEEESIIYIQLLKLGESTPSELATFTNLKRPSVYNYIEKLISKNLVRWIDTPQGKKAAPLDTNNLITEIEKEKQKYTQMSQTVSELVPQLNLLKKQKNFNTEVKYYQGKSGLQKMILNSLNANKNLYGYSLYNRNDMVGRDFMIDFRKEWVKRRLFDHVITNDEEINMNYPKEAGYSEYLNFQEARYITKDKFYISTDIMIYNNVFAVGSMDKNDIFGVEIINEEIVKTQMSIFNIMWDIAKPMKWAK